MTASGEPRRSFVKQRVILAALMACIAVFTAAAYLRDRPRAWVADETPTSRKALSGDSAVLAGARASRRVLSMNAEQPARSIGTTPLRAPASTSPESEISGVVLDATGGPIAGARIVARAGAGHAPGIMATSAETGGFRLGLSAGSWQLSVEADGYAPTRSDLYSPTAEVRLVLSPESVIAGHVVSSAGGQPVAGVTVTAKKSDRQPYSLFSTVSDQSGAFELRQLSAGKHHLRPHSAHYRGQRVSVDLGAADVASGIELVVSPATTVQGEIRAGTAACASGTLELLGPVRLSSGADEAGKVEIQGVPPGSYELTVTCPSALPLREQLVLASSPISRSWELEPGIVVRGSVETAAGQPLAGAVITWTRRREPPRYGAEPAWPASESWCASDVHGEFACSGLERGHYAGALHVQGKLQKAAPELDLQGVGDPPPIRVRADASAMIRVGIDGKSSAPAASIAVFACGGQGEPTLAQRDGQAFVLAGLPLGPYRVHLGTPDCTGTAGVSVDLERDGQVADVALSPPFLAGVRGRLVDSAGAPVPDAWVTISDAHPAWAHLLERMPAVMTDVDGEFGFSGLLPGHYVVFAESTSYAGTARQSVELVPAGVRALRLVLEQPAAGKTLSAPLGRNAMDNTK